MAKKSAKKSTPSLSPAAEAKRKTRAKAAKGKSTASAAKTAEVEIHTEEEAETWTQTEFIKRHDIPDLVVAAAQEYESARAAAVKANDKSDVKKKNVMSLMDEHEVDRVPIERKNKTKLLHLLDETVLKVEASPKDND
jgi:hypothetical protein